MDKLLYLGPWKSTNNSWKICISVRTHSLVCIMLVDVICFEYVGCRSYYCKWYPLSSNDNCSFWPELNNINLEAIPSFEIWWSSYFKKWWCSLVIEMRRFDTVGLFYIYKFGTIRLHNLRNVLHRLWTHFPKENITPRQCGASNLNGNYNEMIWIKLLEHPFYSSL